MTEPGAAVAVGSLPPCNCDHDFYDGTGINFHFEGTCPKGGSLRAVERVMDGLSCITGSWLLTHGLYYGDGRTWNWHEYGGWAPLPDSGASS